MTCILFHEWLIIHVQFWAWIHVHFDIKRQVNILCKIPSDNNVRDIIMIILYCEFSNAVLGHATRRLPGMNEKTQSYIFTSGSRRLRTPHRESPWGAFGDSRPVGALRPLEINMELMCCFLIVTNARQILTMVCKVFDVPFEWAILSTKFLIDQPTLLKSYWYFPKPDFKPKICLRAWWGTQE